MHLSVASYIFVLPMKIMKQNRKIAALGYPAFPETYFKQFMPQNYYH
jgi:hypothetical protein